MPVTIGVLQESAPGEMRVALVPEVAGKLAAAGATVVMVTHDWEGARAHATHALLVDRGLVAFGPAADVAKPSRLLELFGHAGHVHATHGDGGHA